MSLTSASFFVFLAVTIIAFHMSTSVLYRRFVLGSANAVFIASYLNNVTEALPLLAFLALGYLCVTLISLHRSGTVLALGVAAILVTYVFLKRFSFFEPLGRLPFPYLLIGLSYVLFRILHVMIDVRSGIWLSASAPSRSFAIPATSCASFPVRSSAIRNSARWMARRFNRWIPPHIIVNHCISANQI